MSVFPLISYSSLPSKQKFEHPGLSCVEKRELINYRDSIHNLVNEQDFPFEKGKDL